MNPLLLAALVGFGTKALNSGGDFIQKNGKWILLGVGGYYIYNKLSKEALEKEREKLLAEMASNPNTQYAVQLRTAMNIKDVDLGANFLGFEFNPAKWLGIEDDLEAIANWVARTDEQAIFTIATKINDYSAVSQIYYTLYGSVLESDLKKSLTKEEYPKFLAELGKGLANTPSAQYEAARKKWQTNWVPFAGKTTKVWNRYTGSMVIWYRTSQTANSIIAKSKTINLADYLELGTASGTVMEWGNTTGWIKITTNNPSIINIMGNSMFYMKETSLMITPPPTRPR